VAPGPTARRCPWCSELLQAESAVQCPACHATLVPHGDEVLPGLTVVEALATTRARFAESPKRSRLLSWISGDVHDDASDLAGLAPSEALAPPSRDVRRQILRLTLEAAGIPVSESGEVMLPMGVDLDRLAS